MEKSTPLDVYRSVTISSRDLLRYQSLVYTTLAAHHTTILRSFVLIVTVSTFLYLLHQHLSYDDDLPIVNRWFTLEPRIFARWRWAFRSDKILDEAYAKVHDPMNPSHENMLSARNSTRESHTAFHVETPMWSCFQMTSSASSTSCLRALSARGSLTLPP